MNLFKLIFSWWNSQTIGTFIQTSLFGVKVGEDQFKNKYYKNKDDTKRWVIYSDIVDASTVPPEWHSWLHKTIKVIPDKIRFNKFSWQKEHKKNLTGTKKAYLPNHDKKSPYKKWQPK
jgi:NADH:ubiquinone oxidoreductase subunit